MHNWTFIALAFVAACSTEDPGDPRLRTTLLADFPSPSLAVTYHRSSSEHRQYASVEVMYDAPSRVLLEGNKWHCPVVDASIEGELAGIELEIVNPGSFYLLAGSPRCLPPRFEVELPYDAAPAMTKVSVRDGSLELEADLGDVMIPRVFEPVGHAAWSFAPGETVSFTTTPTVAPNVSSLYLLARWDDQLLTTGPNRALDVFIPDTSGSGTLSLDLQMWSSCGAGCALSAEYSVLMAATIE